MDIRLISAILLIGLVVVVDCLVYKQIHKED